MSGGSGVRGREWSEGWELRARRRDWSEGQE